MAIATSSVEEFVHSVMDELATGRTTEHSYRPAFKKLFSSVDKVKSVNEPKQSEYGAPDFVFLGNQNKDLILGYAEMKDIDKNLDEIEKSGQMDRYRGYKNIFLTNNLDFRFFRNGVKYFEIKIGKYDKKSGTITELYQDNYSRLTNELMAFFEQTPESITSGKRLAEIMGGKARRIRDNIKVIFEEHKDPEIEKIYDMMKELLVTDLTKDQFADMYAQTLVYGLFAARYNDETPDNFTRSEARDLVPATNPFLREFFDHIAGANFNKSLSYIVDELCEIFSVSDIKTIVHKHLRLGQDEVSEKDPIIHFYEDFLANYDAELRKKMGAYYTPTPVVRYIVRMVDKVLKEDFGFSDGIASNEKIKYTHRVDPYQSGKTTRSKVLTERTDNIPAVQILDPAVGTATFLNEAIKYIYEEKFENQKGLWNSYVNNNILPRFNGFELMMTPYTIAHLKLGMTLSELGARDLRTRLRVFLTNTLTEGVENDLPLFTLLGLTKVVAEESNLAAEVKNDLPVMVVMGNPPYSGVSSNETKFANSLIEKYKVEPGGQVKLQERKHWLNDDYVKFIAFAEDMIEKNGKGIVAMITNNGYLDNPTFRGMRWHLMKTFDKIYILDLHGNAKKKEVSPDSSPDQNVFDIMQGVGIMIAVKASNNEKMAKIYHSEIYGSRKHKFDVLNNDGVKFKSVKFDEKMCYFVPKNVEGKDEYERGVLLNELMPVNTAGIVTARDNIVIDDDRDVLLKRIEKICDQSYSDNEIRRWLFPNKKDGKYKAGDTRGWKLSEARKNIANNNHDDFIQKISYRPFDIRNIYYSQDMVDWGREKIMKNMLDFGFDECENCLGRQAGRQAGRQGNYAMIFSRGLNEDNSAPIFIVDCVSEHRAFSRANAEGTDYVVPLYVYDKSKKQMGVVFERSVTDDTLVVDSMPEHAVLGTAGFAGQFAPLWILDEESFKYANFDMNKLQELFSDVEQPNKKSRKVYPEDIMDYIYASLHSLSYREKYKEFLKIDFPRVPRPKSWKEFWRLVELGNKLRELHLMCEVPKSKVTFPIDGDNVVEKISYNDGKVYINKTQHFDNVSGLAWNFYIGGYQPAQKWLKDRKSRELNTDDILHYEKIIAILEETDKIMKEIG